jgi:hypothetical protein
VPRSLRGCSSWLPVDYTCTQLEERAVMARRVLPVKVTPGQGTAASVKGSLDIASVPAEPTAIMMLLSGPA